MSIWRRNADAAGSSRERRLPARFQRSRWRPAKLGWVQFKAHSKGAQPGLFEPTPKAEREGWQQVRRGRILHVNLLHRAVRSIQTPDGFRAVHDGRPVSPASAERYLRGKFGAEYEAARLAMAGLARSLPPRDLAHCAYSLYQRFRPEIPPGVGGWGAAGRLDLDLIEELARREPV